MQYSAVPKHIHDINVPHDRYHTRSMALMLMPSRPMESSASVLRRSTTVLEEIGWRVERVRESVRGCVHRRLSGHYRFTERDREIVRQARRGGVLRAHRSAFKRMLFLTLAPTVLPNASPAHPKAAGRRQ